MGNLDTSTVSQQDFSTALSNRDAVIQKLSSSLHRVMTERRHDALLSRQLEVTQNLVHTSFDESSRARNLCPLHFAPILFYLKFIQAQILSLIAW